MSTQRYRIGLFTDTYLHNPNGVSTSVLLLSEELRRLGHEAWVVAPSGAKVRSEDSYVIRLPSVSYPLYTAQRIAAATPSAFRPNYDLIHTHTPLTVGQIGIWIARQRNLAHVSTFHVHYEKYLHYLPALSALNRRVHLADRLLKAFYRRADIVLAPSNFAKSLVESYGLRSPARVVPNGLNFSVLDNAPTEESAWPAGTRRVISVGRLSKEKDVEVLLRAIVRLKTRANIHLVLVGEGPERASTMRLVSRFGVADCVTVLAPVIYSRIGGFIRSAEVFLLASQSETQGMATWEAQALGVPVVAVGAGGSEEAVIHGQTGFLVAPGDALAMADRTLEILGNDRLRSYFAQRARERARQQTAEVMARDVVQFYEEATVCRQLAGYYS